VGECTIIDPDQVGCKVLRPACGCDGTLVNLICSGLPDGFAPKPVAETGACPDTGPASSSCEALVLWFVGCDESALTECEREYSAVSVAARADVDAAVACLAALPSRPGPAGTPTWPSMGVQACTPASDPALLSTSSCDATCAVNELWFHGGCEGATGSATTAMTTDPGFPPCQIPPGDDSSEAGCFFGEANADATL